MVFTDLVLLILDIINTSGDCTKSGLVDTDFSDIEICCTVSGMANTMTDDIFGIAIVAPGRITCKGCSSFTCGNSALQIVS